MTLKIIVLLTIELLKSLKLRHIGHGEVPRGVDDIVKFLCRQHCVFFEPLHPDGEVVCGGVVLDITAHVVKLDEAPEVVDLPAALEVVEEDLPRREGGDLLAKVLLELVVGELEGLLGRVRPEVAVHAAMHWLSILVRSCKVESKSIYSSIVL